MTSKNNTPNFSDSFNRKKTLDNDIKRLSNIHKKYTQYIPMFKSNISSIKNQSSQYNTTNSVTNLHHLYSSKTSANIDLNIKRENLDFKIPKITLKDISIPSYYDFDNFDLKKINDNINQSIKITILQPTIIHENIDDINISVLKNKNIHKIYHIYQEKYSDNIFTTGLGDFIRSCFFIIQFCNKYGFQYEIIINHPIAVFLNKFSNSHPNFTDILSIKPIDNITMFKETNWINNIYDKNNYIQNFQLSKEKFNNFILYLSELPVINNAIFSYNIYFPIYKISLEEKNIISSLFQPSNVITQYLNEVFSLLSISPYDFITIHIRSGDMYLNNKTKIFNFAYLNIIYNEINLIISNNSNKHILLIADNNEIKYLLKQQFPNIKILFKEITHLGEGVKLIRDKIKNTLIDFYLMSCSSYIYSFTSYPHGSGFSYWCSVMYNIPYKCKYINIKEF